MIHEMHLNNLSFKAMKNGTKKIEIRVNDEKRQKVKEGDEIIFSNIETKETINVKVSKIEKFDSFEELVNSFDLENFGKCRFNSKKELIEINKKRYLDEEKLEVLAIRIEKI